MRHLHRPEMVKRALLVVLAAMFLGAGGFATASASASVVPKEGHYSGHDNHGNKVGFRYSKAHGMNHFTLDYSHQIGGGAVAGSHWGESCHVGYCTSGTWSNSTTVHGHFTNSRTKVTFFWTAHWVRNPNAGVTH